MQVCRERYPSNREPRKATESQRTKTSHKRLLGKDTGGWLPLLRVRSSRELSGRQAYLTFPGVEISRVGIGGIPSPELGQAQRLVGFQAQGLVVFLSSEICGSSEPRNELGLFTLQK